MKEEQDLGCMGRAKQVWTCPPTRDTEGTGKAGTFRATGLLRGWLSGALHELCAWHRVWGWQETEHPEELTGILPHKFGKGRIGVSWLCSQQAGGHRGIEGTGLQYFSISSQHIGKAGSDKQPREQSKGGRERAFWRCHRHNHHL